jgi:predicted transcriptional regulator of viral defense system
LITDELVEDIAQESVVTTEEIKQRVERIKGEDQESDYVYRKFIYPLLKKSYVERIRQGLYHVTTPGKQDTSADRYLVASKIREEYYIGFHSALAFYGSAYSSRNQVHIAVKPEKRFDEFRYQNTVYTPYLTQDTSTGVSVEYYRGKDIRIASKERVFIECVEKPDYVGGWEETLKSLEALSGLDFPYLTELLLEKENQTLLRKVGLILEKLRERSLFYEHLSEANLDRLHESVTSGMRYLVPGEPGKPDETWHLYIPTGFWTYLRGI